MKNQIVDSRKTAGWSQEQLASMLGVSRQTVIALERGRYNPSLPLAFRLTRTFNTSIEELFSYDDDEAGNQGGRLAGLNWGHDLHRSALLAGTRDGVLAPDLRHLG